MFCSSCGAKLADKDSNCPSCGSRSLPRDQGDLGVVDPLLGRTLEEKYRLDGRIGAGGMATVYRATRLLIGDAVAIKILHPSHVSDPQSAERFRREAQAAARLKHPNVVTIYDFGVTNDGLVYLVMELVEGESLRTVIKRQGPFTPSAAALVMTQVCAALDLAHANQVVHRDVKPDNILIDVNSPGLPVKVVDFGIARLRDIAASNLTQTGAVMGTPHYMSPEQCLGEELDSRSDIYSLGVVLYEMLTGVVPFNSPTSSAVIVQHVNQPPTPLRSLNLSIPQAVEAVVLQALQKDRAARPSSAGSLAQKLSEALNLSGSPRTAEHAGAYGGTLAPTMQIPTPTHGTGAMPFPTPTQTGPRAAETRRWLLPAVAGAAFALAVVSIGGVYILTSDNGRKEDVAQFEAEPLVGEPAAEQPAVAGPAGDAQIAPSAANRVVDGGEPDQNRLVGSSSSAPSDRGASLPAPRDQKPPPKSAVAPVRPTSAARVTIKTDPNASSVQIDGGFAGVTDTNGYLQVAELTAGEHLIEVKKEHHRAETRRVRLSPGEAQVVEFRLAALPGLLKVTANVPGAAIGVANVGRYSDRANVELPPGSYQVTCEKPFFRPQEITARVNPGETTNLTVTLEAMPDADILAKAEGDFRKSAFAAVAAAALHVLNKDARNPRANLLLGLSNYRSGKFAGTAEYLAQAAELGETVTLPIKHHHRAGLNDDLCGGELSFTKDTLEFRPSGGGHDFVAPYSKIYELKSEPAKGGRFHVKVGMQEGKKEERKTYNFHVPGAQLRRYNPSSQLIVVDCQGCDAEVRFFTDLILRLKR